MLESIGFDATLRSFLEMVLSYISCFKKTECVIHTDSEEMTTIRYNVSLMRQDEAHVSALHAQLANNELTMKTIRMYVCALGGNSSGSAAAIKEILRKWIQAGVERRPYMMKNKVGLIKEAKRRVTNYQATRNKQEEEIIYDLVAQDRLDGRREGLSQLDELQVTLLERLSQSAFLPKLTANEKEYCKRGHHLEPKLAKELQKDSDGGKTPFKIHAIYSTGMVRRRDKPYVKDSIDFLAVADIDDELKVTGLEMKARVAPSTEQQERLSSESSQSQNSDTNVLTYVVIDWNSANLGQYITCAHEAVQILHHAYTFDLEHVALIVGDNNGGIIRGVFVKFDSDLKLAYGNVMTTLYNFCLKWAYDNTESAGRGCHNWTSFR